MIFITQATWINYIKLLLFVIDWAYKIINLEKKPRSSIIMYNKPNVYYNIKKSINNNNTFSGSTDERE